MTEKSLHEKIRDHPDMKIPMASADALRAVFETLEATPGFHQFWRTLSIPDSIDVCYKITGGIRAALHKHFVVDSRP